MSQEKFQMVKQEVDLAIKLLEKEIARKENENIPDNFKTIRDYEISSLNTSIKAIKSIQNVINLIDKDEYPEWAKNNPDMVTVTFFKKGEKRETIFSKEKWKTTGRDIYDVITKHLFKEDKK